MRFQMARLGCSTCGSVLANGMAVCSTCGQEVNDDANPPVFQRTGHRRRNAYGILAIFLAVAGGVAVLIFTGLLPNPMKGDSTAAIVNGEKISLAEVDQKLEVYRKMSAKGGQKDSSGPGGKAAEAEKRMQILQTLIQEKILVTEATKEKITAAPQEIADRISAVKKDLNFSDQDFDGFLLNNGMTLASFEKRIEKVLLIEKLIDKGTKERSLTRDAWLAELLKRAKVEQRVK
jgi:hypothetical protein